MYFKVSINLSERQSFREGEKENLPTSASHSQDGHNGQSRARLKSGARISILDSCLAGRGPSTCAAFCHLPRLSKCLLSTRWAMQCSLQHWSWRVIIKVFIVEYNYSKTWILSYNNSFNCFGFSLIMDYPLRPTFGGYTLSVFVILHVGERQKKTFKGEDWVKGYNKQADRGLWTFH